MRIMSLPGRIRHTQPCSWEALHSFQGLSCICTIALLQSDSTPVLEINSSLVYDMKGASSLPPVVSAIAQSWFAHFTKENVL